MAAKRKGAPATAGGSAKPATKKKKKPAKPPANDAARMSELEAKSKIADTSKRLLDTQDTIDKTSERFGKQKAEAKKVLRESVEATHNGSNEQKGKVLDGIVVAWQHSDEVEADRKQTMHPLLDDRDKLRKRIREQIENINQPDLPGID